MFQLQKLNKCLKVKCFKSFKVEKENKNHGKEELIKYVLYLKHLLVNHQNLNDILDQLDYVLKKQM